MICTKDELWEIWAPPRSIWSAWAKPVLIAQLKDEFAIDSYTPKGDLRGSRPMPIWESLDVSALPRSNERTAIVVDVEGTLALSYGLALAKRGFQPVPLFNVCAGPMAIVPVDDLQAALVAAGPDLAAIMVPDAAPPAFLLDANRQKDSSPAQPGQFDNRWMTFPQDFPSGHLLRSREIDSAVIVQDSADQPREDLAHVLLRWQESGIRIALQDTRIASPPQAITVARPRGYRALWYRALAMLGLRRNSAGGFGVVIPQPSDGGGFG